MAFCLFKLKNSLVNKASFAIYSARLPGSLCFACQLESVNGHCVAIARTSSTVVHYKLYNDQLHPPAAHVSKPHPQVHPLLGVKDFEDSTVKSGLSELFYRDPLSILLSAKLLTCEVSRHTQLPPEDAAETKAAPNGSNQHQDWLPFTGRLHSPQQQHQYISACSLSSISYKLLTNSSQADDLTATCVASQLPGSSSAVLLASPAPKPRDECSPVQSTGGDDPSALPSDDKLQRVHDALIKSLSEFFKKPLDYTIYDKGIIFENRFRGTTTRGLSMYVMQMSLLNTVGHIRYAAVKLDIIKTTVHPEEGTIKVRWRIKAIKPTKAISAFWTRRFRLREIQQADSSNWYDGFSTFHVNGAGLISKHVADNMMPDDDKLRSPTKAGMFAKMAAMLGLMPRPAAGHSSVIQEIPSLF